MDWYVQSGANIGSIILPKHETIATNVRWKQVASYYCTGDSTNGAILADILVFFRKVTSVGLSIQSVTSDMGSPNQAMWTLLFWYNHDKGTHPGRYLT